jgi:hypothetical protein
MYNIDKGVSYPNNVEAMNQRFSFGRSPFIVTTTYPRESLWGASSETGHAVGFLVFKKEWR